MAEKWSPKCRPKTDNEAPFTRIVDVNIDCLEHILKNLELNDLINVTAANKQLAAAAVTVFAQKLKGKTVNIEILRQFTSNQMVQTIEITNDSIFVNKLANALRILRLLGICITKLEINWKFLNYNDAVDCNKKILYYINEYCSATLKSIAMEFGPGFTNAEMRKPFKNIEEVSIVYSRLKFDLSHFHTIFPKLRRLELIHTGFKATKRFTAKFQRLEHLKLSFIGSNDVLTKIDAAKIIHLSPQLQSLTIYGDLDLEFWNYVNKQLKKLKILDLYYDQDNIHAYPKHPIRFECVETLTLNIQPSLKKWKLEKLFSFKQLKKCTVTGYLYRSCIDFISENQTIEILNVEDDFYLFSPYFPKNMEKLIANLPNLTELSLTGCSCFSNAVIQFLNKSHIVRLSMTFNHQTNLDVIHSTVIDIPQWTATHWNQSLVIERKTNTICE